MMTFFLGLSCQEEANEETLPNEEETIVPNSTLENLMRYTSANDGSVDDIMDDSDCFTVNLPVTIIANGITLTIESLDDLSLLEEIFDASNTDVDGLEFLFPITIILNDYTEVNIESLEELEAFIDACITNENVIECVDFIYPISFSIYNTDFQVIDTVLINNDYEMYIFLEGLDNGNNGVVLASLNFPVGLEYSDGSTTEVNNNQELQEAIEAAEQDCSTVECDLDLDGLESWLLECSINANTYDNSGNIIDENFLEFNQNGEVIVNGTPAVTEVGSWTLSEVNSEYVLTIDGLLTFDLLNGQWSLTGCERDRTVFSQETGSSIITMELEHDCSNSPLGCLETNDIILCDENNDGFEVFNLYEGLSDIDGCTINNAVSVSFHASLIDAESNTNPIPSATSYTNNINPQTVYVRIEEFNNASVFEILEIGLYLENCNATCSEQEIDAYLVECTWNVVQFNNSNDLIGFDLVFLSGGTLIITGDGQTITVANGWSTSTSASGTVLTLTGVALGNIQAINGEWLIVECAEDRLELVAENRNSTMVMEQDCSGCNNPGTLTNDLIIYMPFGGEVKDLISGDIVDGFTYLTEDRSGNSTCAISFDGSTNFSIPVTAENQLVQGDSFSISLWFKMQNTIAGDLELLFRKPGNATVGFNLGVYDLNTPLFTDNLGTSLWDNDWNQEVDVNWENTDWHHLVVTVDSNNTVRLYRDGVLRNMEENSSLSIGSDPAGQYMLGEGFQGHMDDLRVYKRTLSNNEVGDLHQLEADCFNCL